MANEIKIRYTASNRDLYAVIINAAGQIYVPETSTFVTIDDENWDDYVIELDEQDGTQIYYKDEPAGLDANTQYNILVYEQGTGGSVVGSDDPLVGQGVLHEQTAAVSTNITQISGSSTAADNLELDYTSGFDKTNSTVGADVVKISGDGTAADNLEKDYDGTGYDKTNSSVGDVAASIWDAQRAAHADPGSFGEQVNTEVDQIGVDLTDITNKVNDIKDQTDQMNFVGDDVKATLDGEEVNVKDPLVPPTKEENAKAVRDELSTELDRIDAPVSDCTKKGEVSTTTGSKATDSSTTTGSQSS